MPPAFANLLRASSPLLAGVIVLAATSRPVVAASPDFNRDVRPILSDNCYTCHGPDPASREARLAIDALVTARLQALGLTPSPEADPETLARRLYLDVIGLPPSPAEVEAFKRNGFEATLDTLLQNEAYGENWARTWLDAARYSDSKGFEKDRPREQWAWRDWVIRSLNRDQPYDAFIVEQVAGDLLPGATQDQHIATGLLRNSMINEEGAIVPEQFRIEELFDRVDCLSRAVIGMTMQCAQCHTHKFDPITHDEYFGVFAFLNDTYEAQSWVYTEDQQSMIDELKRTLAHLDAKVQAARPNWTHELAAWEENVRAQQVPWTLLTATELGSTSGLNHPTQEADGSILSLGHPTTRGMRPAGWPQIARLLDDTRQRLSDGWLSAREVATGDAAKLPDLTPGTTPQDAAAWTVVARVLLNLDETLTKR